MFYWVVVLTKDPPRGDWATGYFPRYCYYKVNAQEIVDEVRRKGGEAKITREKG